MATMPVAPPEGWPSGSEKGESHFLETSCFHAALIFLRALFSFQTLILPSTSAVMSELSVVEDAPAVADPSAVLPAASANGSANGAAMHLLAANGSICHGLAFPCSCVCHS